MANISGTVVYPVRLERDLYDKLRDAARADDRSIANFLRVTIKNAVQLRMAENEAVMSGPNTTEHRSIAE